MVHPGQASRWYDPHGPHCGLAPTLTHLRTSPWVCLLKGLCLGTETISSVPALEGERSGDNLLVRAVRGRCLISQQQSIHALNLRRDLEGYPVTGSP